MLGLLRPAEFAQAVEGQGVGLNPKVLFSADPLNLVGGKAKSELADGVTLEASKVMVVARVDERFSADAVELGSVQKINQVKNLSVHKPLNGPENSCPPQGGVVSPESRPEFFDGKTVTFHSQRTELLGKKPTGTGLALP